MKYGIQVDKKWQKKWDEWDLNTFDMKHDQHPEKKLYILEMFSYPSGANLHVGHWYNYSLPDSYARMKRMQGFHIFQPMGFDAFGLPAENYAIKTGIHPMDSTKANIQTMEKQLKELGGMFAFDHEISTCLPEYYKWTQWLFLQLYKKNLAYRKNALVNWCPSCQTVLANEQVTDKNECERCNTEITRKNLTQWFFKITDYAQELLDGLPGLNWPEKTIKIQQNWIGRSEGNEVSFAVENSDLVISVFTTRVDTLCGVSYLVVAPESELCSQLTTSTQADVVSAYIEETKKISEIDRMSTSREKTGVFTGSYAIHPISKKRVAIYAADYVIAGYGTGAVMGVAAHDTRDFEFAKKYDLPINPVIYPSHLDSPVDENGHLTFELPYTEYGTLFHSDSYDGLTSKDAMKKIMQDLETNNMGQHKINYRLKDWLVSRQRYWGAPIPMIHCEHCGIVPVPEKDLPVLLPYDVEFKPDGKSPLAKSSEFMNCTCPSCGKAAKRDPDTLDTFVCSSWYYLRYIDPKNNEQPFDPSLVDTYAPVDVYVGGAEHAAMHLLYARFITKALRDMGYLKFDEPFLRLIHQGFILGSDGSKMSKSLGNTVSPDEYIQAYGSDVFRLYLAFGFAYTDGGPWNDNGIKSVDRLIGRISRLVDDLLEKKSAMASNNQQSTTNTMATAEHELEYARHFAIKGVTTDSERFQFNTSIARIMEFVSALIQYGQAPVSFINVALYQAAIEDLLKLIAPFAPHFAEEEWSLLGYDTSIFNATWPILDETKLVKSTVEIAIQVNGKILFKLDINPESTDDEVKALVLEDERIKEKMKTLSVKKFIYVKGRLVNLVLTK